MSVACPASTCCVQAVQFAACVQAYIENSRRECFHMHRKSNSMMKNTGNKGANNIIADAIRC